MPMGKSNDLSPSIAVLSLAIFAAYDPAFHVTNSLVRLLGELCRLFLTEYRGLSRQDSSRSTPSASSVPSPTVNGKSVSRAENFCTPLVDFVLILAEGWRIYNGIKAIALSAGSNQSVLDPAERVVAFSLLT